MSPLVSNSSPFKPFALPVIAGIGPKEMVKHLADSLPSKLNKVIDQESIKEYYFESLTGQMTVGNDPIQQWINAEILGAAEGVADAHKGAKIKQLNPANLVKLVGADNALALLAMGYQMSYKLHSTGYTSDRENAVDLFQKLLNQLIKNQFSSQQTIDPASFKFDENKIPDTAALLQKIKKSSYNWRQIVTNSIKTLAIGILLYSGYQLGRHLVSNFAGSTNGTVPTPANGLPNANQTAVAIPLPNFSTNLLSDPANFTGPTAQSLANLTAIFNASVPNNASVVNPVIDTSITPPAPVKVSSPPATAPAKGPQPATAKTKPKTVPKIDWRAKIVKLLLAKTTKMSSPDLQQLSKLTPQQLPPQVVSGLFEKHLINTDAKSAEIDHALNMLSLLPKQISAQMRKDYASFCLQIALLTSTLDITPADLTALTLPKTDDAAITKTLEKIQANIAKITVAPAAKAAGKTNAVLAGFDKIKTSIHTILAILTDAKKSPGRILANVEFQKMVNELRGSFQAFQDISASSTEAFDLLDNQTFLLNALGTVTGTSLKPPKDLILLLLEPMLADGTTQDLQALAKLMQAWLTRNPAADTYKERSLIGVAVYKKLLEKGSHYHQPAMDAVTGLIGINTVDSRKAALELLTEFNAKGLIGQPKLPTLIQQLISTTIKANDLDYRKALHQQQVSRVIVENTPGFMRFAGRTLGSAFGTVKHFAGILDSLIHVPVNPYYSFKDYLWHCGGAGANIIGAAGNVIGLSGSAVSAAGNFVKATGKVIRVAGKIISAFSAIGSSTDNILLVRVIRKLVGGVIDFTGTLITKVGDTLDDGTGSSLWLAGKRISDLGVAFTVPATYFTSSEPIPTQVDENPLLIQQARTAHLQIGSLQRSLIESGQFDSVADIVSLWQNTVADKELIVTIDKQSYPLVVAIAKDWLAQIEKKTCQPTKAQIGTLVNVGMVWTKNDDPSIHDAGNDLLTRLLYLDQSPEVTDEILKAAKETFNLGPFSKDATPAISDFKLLEAVAKKEKDGGVLLDTILSTPGKVERWLQRGCLAQRTAFVDALIACQKMPPKVASQVANELIKSIYQWGQLLRYNTDNVQLGLKLSLAWVQTGHWDHTLVQVATAAINTNRPVEMSYGLDLLLAAVKMGKGKAAAFTNAASLANHNDANLKNKAAEILKLIKQPPA